MTPAEAIRSARERAGLTRRAVAHALSIDKTRVRAWERTDALPRNLARLHRLARTIAMTPDERGIVAGAMALRDLGWESKRVDVGIDRVHSTTFCDEIVVSVYYPEE